MPPYRLALDLGSTSIGWCVLTLDKDRPASIRNMGVRIFSDGRDAKTLEPLAVARRNARGMRRNLDRRDLRQKRLMTALIKHSLMPADDSARRALETLDPYELRARALDQALSPHELGRALFHINQRRGFKSNRKTDKRENDSSNMKAAIKDLDAKLIHTNSRTLGEYLYKEHLNKQPVRVRTHMEKNKAAYNFYPGREMYQKEFDAIIAKQALPAEIADDLRDIIFYQRPLKPARVGKCRFESGEERARLALPLVQKFRILQEVNNLETQEFMEGDPRLTAEDREQIVKSLLENAKRTFGQIRKLVKLGSGARFNLESERREGLKGDLTSVLLGDQSCFGSRWKDFSNSQQSELIDLLMEEQDPDELIYQLVNKWDLSLEQAETAMQASMPEGYGSVSAKAIEKMMPYLEQGLKYNEAAEKAGYHHSDFRTGRVYERLPYYGQILPNNVIGGSFEDKDAESPEKYFGKVNNPSVHIVLNQVQKLVNNLIDTYGAPEEVVVELARDLKEPREDIIKDQTKNTKDNERINKELVKLGIKENYRNRMVYKLWEDLSQDPTKRCCPFSGIQIAAHEIFSGNFEEEHLLPFSRSYNDGRANKVLSHISANREKKNRSPFEAFGHTDRWKDITARIQNLPSAKQWRFQQDCWDIAKGQGEDIIARLLNDTRYMSRLTKQYLSAVFDNEKGKSKVWAIPGQMTALLRDKWGLNDLLGEEDGNKDRTDHRHHAIDAAVIGCTDRWMLKYLGDAARTVEEKPDLWNKRRKLVSGFGDPFPDFQRQIREKVAELIVSYKPDHGNAARAARADRPYTTGALHDQTAYGLIGKGPKDTIYVATRKAVDSFTTLKHIEDIADATTKQAIKSRLNGIKENSAEWKNALAAFSAETGTRRIRVHIQKNQDVMIAVKQPNDRGPQEGRGQSYKLYATGNNYCAEIYCTDKGKNSGKWQCEIIPTYHAHQKEFIPNWRKENPTAKLIMRLQIDDMVAYEEDGETKITRVKKMTGGRVYLRPHRVAAETGDKLSWAASPGLMQEKNARKISVDILGRVKDPRAIERMQKRAA